jgi:hypothetical protein
MSESEADTSRTVVQTYVPAYQREEWDDHAEQLGMSRSEFVRTMVQAGRSGFGAEPATAGESDEESTDESVPLADRVREVLAESGPLDWEDLLAAVTGDIESRLEETLQELQSDDVVRYSGREGGYVLETEGGE